jgi:hypothetical protein
MSSHQGDHGVLENLLEQTTSARQGHGALGLVFEKSPRLKISLSSPPFGFFLND